jgi:hypothetical protein
LEIGLLVQKRQQRIHSVPMESDGNLYILRIGSERRKIGPTARPGTVSRIHLPVDSWRFSNISACAKGFGWFFFAVCACFMAESCSFNQCEALYRSSGTISSQIRLSCGRNAGIFHLSISSNCLKSTEYILTASVNAISISCI